MRPQGRTAERELARISHESHGVVTRRQLATAGLTPSEIRHRVASGSLLRVHRGVYRVGHRAPSVEASYLAAVLACGEGAVLSGRAAAHLYGLLRGQPPRAEVTAPSQRTVAGVSTRRVRNGVLESTTRRGIPVTTVARTLVDLAGDIGGLDLARACHEAQVRYATSPEQVETVLARCPSRPGAGVLRRILLGDLPVTLSALEVRFLERLRTAGLPLPLTNTLSGGRRVDCRWPERRLTVELDGYRYHRSRHAWELDRRREREARARGDEFRRYTYGDVAEDPELVLVELRDLLAT